MDVESIILEGENIYVEFKSWIKIKDKKNLNKILAKEAVAFSNAKGGLILGGVEDDGETTGCKNYNAQTIIEFIYDMTMPNIFSEIEEFKINNETILGIKIQRGNSICATSAGELYKRLGENSKTMLPNEFKIIGSEKKSCDFTSFIEKNV